MGADPGPRKGYAMVMRREGTVGAVQATERRLFRRYETALPARFVVQGEEAFDCVIRDLSLGGARLVPGRPELTGRTGRLCFEELWHPPGLPARVVAADEACVRLAFELDPLAEQALTFFLAAVVAD